MMNINNVPVIKAVPLHLITLDSQIRSHGGDGFNSSVIVLPVPNSFSVKYVFDTNKGKKVLITVNEVQLKMFDDGVYHFIQFNGDSKSYTSVSPKHLPVPPYKVLLVEHLGNSFEEMQQAIKAKWGNRNTNIMHPDTLRLV